MARTSDSSNRIAMPCRVLRITWSPALVRATPMSWSPSSSPSAMIPRPRGRRNAVSSVFLTVPRRVTIIRHSSSRNSRTGTSPVIFSPSASCSRLTIARPPEVRVAIGRS